MLDNKSFLLQITAVIPQPVLLRALLDRTVSAGVKERLEKIVKVSLNILSSNVTATGK